MVLKSRPKTGVGDKTSGTKNLMVAEDWAGPEKKQGRRSRSTQIPRALTGRGPIATRGYRELVARKTAETNVVGG